MRMKLSAFIFISVGIMALTASCGSRRSEVVHVTDVLKVDTTVLNEGHPIRSVWAACVRAKRWSSACASRTDAGSP